MIIYINYLIGCDEKTRRMEECPGSGGNRRAHQVELSARLKLAVAATTAQVWTIM